MLAAVAFHPNLSCMRLDRGALKAAEMGENGAA